MKKIILLLAAVSVVLSCSKENEKETSSTGAWFLIEIYNDPGDGSGDYEPVDSDKTVQFSQQNTIVTTNKSFCPFDPTADGSTAVYNETEGFILPDDCFELERTIRYRIEGGNLILEYPCI